MKVLVFSCVLAVALAVAQSQDFDGFDGFDASSFDTANFGGQDLTGFDTGSFDNFAEGAGANEFVGGTGGFGGADFNLGQFSEGQFGGDGEGFVHFQKK